MIQSRRNVLNDLPVRRTYHAGLWLDKFVKNQLESGERLSKDQNSPPYQLLKEVATDIDLPSEYAAFFTRWQVALKSCGATTRVATVQGRMVVGLGDESVLETSVALHHTYGVPYIPGSALKGLAASYARQRLDQDTWGAASQAYQILFGDTATAGYITFYDALYVPGSGHQGRALYTDVMTVHHPRYYQEGQSAPADWDSPTPIPFLSATGQYLIAVAGPTQEWIDRAFGILQLALGVIGIGAKTSSGYGRLCLEAPALKDAKSAQHTAEPVAVPVNPEQARVNSMIQQVQQLRNRDVAGQIAHHVDRWRNLEAAESLKREFARAILAKVREAGREKASQEKTWYQEIKAYVEQNDTQ